MAVQTLAVNWGNLAVGFLVVWFLIVCVLMILAVLIQKPQGGGLAGAFGSGAGSGQTAFGAKTGDALTWFTVGVFAVWLITAVTLNLITQPETIRATPTVRDTGVIPEPPPTMPPAEMQFPRQGEETPDEPAPAGEEEIPPAQPNDPSPEEPAPSDPEPETPGR